MIWVIGDIHGEYPALKRLLSRIKAQDNNPCIFCIGDITGRGCDSLSVAEWVLNEQIPLVLGNHDSFLLSVYAGANSPSAKDNLGKIIESTLFENYCAYLGQSPLFRITVYNQLLVHAGVHPNWTLDFLKEIGNKYNCLNLKEKCDLLIQKPHLLDDDLLSQVFFITNVRYIHKKTLQPNYKDKSHWPSSEKLRPWYLCERKITNSIIFGHWAALGLYANNNVWCIDGGVAWGKNLFAIGFEENGRSTLLSEPR